MLRDQHSTNPSRPWYMWFCPGANHAPHHCPQEYIDKYKGKFDDGYEAYREWVLPRMIEKGILPKGTELTPLNPLPGDVANAARHGPAVGHAERRREEAVLAPDGGLRRASPSTPTRRSGRIIDYLEQTGQLENTMVIYAADNGASGEGSPNGSVNENKFFNGYPDELAENLKLIDKLGGPDTYEHYPTGWAAATSTPFKMFKRYSEYAGGTCDPLVISWPKGIKARGEVRNQYHHSTDIVPTILDVCGLEMPKVYRGVEQYPLSGVSMRYTFDAPTAPTQKKRQYYAMLGTRAIWEDGWKAVALHAPISGKGHLDKDVWELYHVDVDPAESKDLAKEHPEKLQALIKAWFEEADKNLVLPIDDRTALEQLNIERPSDEAARDRYVYYPGHLAGAGRRRRQRARPVVQDPRRRRDHRSELLGRHLRARLAVRRPLAVHQGQEAALRLQLPRHPAGTAVRVGRAQARKVHTRHGVHAREGRHSTTNRSAPPSST